MLVSRKVRFGPKAVSTAKNQLPNAAGSAVNYTESELKYVEERLALQHLQNARNFNFDPITMDPVELIKLYSTKVN